MTIGRVGRGWLGLVLACAGSAGVALERPVAVVLDLRGQAELRTGDINAPLQMLDTLPSGAVLRLAPGANVVAGYANAVWDLRGNGRFEVRADGIAALDPGASAKLRPAPPSRSLRLVPEQVVQGAVKMRAAVATVVLAQPRGTVMAGEGLVFRWTGPAASFRFELIDDDGLVVAMTETEQHEWRAPATLRLNAEETYLWRVSWVDGSTRREARAEFSLLSAAERAQWQAARPGAKASVAERSRYALALEQRGLVLEAAAMWRELALERPQVAPRGAVP